MPGSLRESKGFLEAVRRTLAARRASKSFRAACIRAHANRRICSYYASCSAQTPCVQAVHGCLVVCTLDAQDLEE